MPSIRPLPGRRPRWIARVTGTPTASAMTVASTASCRLETRAPVKGAYVTAFSNHCSEKPCGGKVRVRPPVNAVATTNRIGTIITT